MPTITTKLNRDCRDLRKLGLDAAAAAVEERNRRLVEDLIFCHQAVIWGAASVRFLRHEPGAPARTKTETKILRTLLSTTTHLAEAEREGEVPASVTFPDRHPCHPHPHIAHPIGDGDESLPPHVARNAAAWWASAEAGIPKGPLA